MANESANNIVNWNSNDENKKIQILYLGGDRHKIGYVYRDRNPWGKFSCYTGSGWSAHHLGLVPGEEDPALYDVLYEGYQQGDGYYLVMQYLRGVITDKGSDGGVEVTGSLRYLQPNEPNPRWLWSMNTLGSEIDETWPYIAP